MKKVSYMQRLLCVATSFLAVASCSETIIDDAQTWSPSQQARALGLTVSELAFNHYKQTKDVGVKAEGIPWRFDKGSGIDWFSISPAEGSGNGTTAVHVAVEENVSFVTRSASPELKSTDASFPRNYKLFVTQAPPAANLTVSRSNISIDGSATTIPVTVTSTREWTPKVAGSATWIKAVKSGNALNITVDANTTETGRNGEVVFELTDAPGYTAPKISITQSSAKVTSTIQNMYFDHAQANQKFTITADADWAANTSATWLDVTPKSGAKGSQQLTVTVVDNHEGERTGTVNVWIAGSNASSKQNLEVKVTQGGTQLRVNTNKMDFTKEGGKGSFTVTANTEWSLTKDADWVHIDQPSGNKNTTVTVTIDPNDGLERNAALQLLDVKDNNRPVATININQKGTDLIVTPAKLDLPVTEGTATLQVTSRMSWKVTTSQSWIKLMNGNTEVTSLSGKDDGDVTIKLLANTTTSPRSGAVIFSDQNGTELARVSISQATSSLTVSTSSLTFDADGGGKNGKKSFTVEAQDEWKLEVPDWLYDVEPKEGKSGKTTVEVKAKLNETSAKRSAEIAVQNKVGATMAWVTVTQPCVSMTIDQNSLQYTYGGGNKNVKITSTSPWALVSVPDWITATKEGAAGTQVLAVQAHKFEERGYRDYNLEIKYKNDESATVRHTIYVQQQGINVSCDKPSLSFGASRETQEIKITTNSNWWQLSVYPAGWIELSKNEGSADATVQVTATANPTEKMRECELILKDVKGEVQRIKVSQGSSAFSVYPSNLSFEVKGGKQTFSVNAKTAWKLVPTDKTWLKVDPDNGEGSDKNVEVTVTAEPNPYTTARSADIQLLNSAGTVMQKVSVTQEAGHITADASKFNFDAVGGDQTLSVKANVGWKLTKQNLDWLTLKPSSGTGDYDVTLTASENTTDSDRKGTLILCNSDGTKEVKKIDVEQKALQLSISTSSATYSADGESKTLTVTANGAWTASSDVSWASVNPTSGSGNKVLTVNVDANPSTQKRTGKITITSGSLSKVYTITQEGNEVSMSANHESLSFVAAGGEKILQITSNADWTLAEYANWIELGATEGKAGVAAVVVTVLPNDTEKERSAKLFLKYGSATKQTITVTQAGKVADQTLSGSLSQTDFDSAGGPATLSIQGNLGWKVEFPSWVTCNPENGTGTATVSVTVTPNTTINSRNGQIKLLKSSGEQVDAWDISQSGMSEQSGDTHYFNSIGGSEDFYPGSSWTAEVVDGSDWIKLAATSGTASNPVGIITNENNSVNARTGHVKITYGGNVYTHTIYQYGKTLSVSRSTESFFAKGGTCESFSVEADRTPTVKSNANWLTVTQTGKNFTLTAAQNTGSQKRTATVTITLSGVADLSRTVTVTQAGVNGSFGFDGFADDEDWTDR